MGPRVALTTLVAAVATLLVFGLFLVSKGDEAYSIATVGAKEINLELAITAKEQSQGLSDRTTLNDDAGLLFIYEEPRKVGIWMKDMNFPIDVLWIDEDYKILDIVEDMSPDSYDPDGDSVIYGPEFPVSYILEVNAGITEEADIEVGDTIELT